MPAWRLYEHCTFFAECDVVTAHKSNIAADIIEPRTNTQDDSSSMGIHMVELPVITEEALSELLELQSARLENDNEQSPPPVESRIPSSPPNQASRLLGPIPSTPTTPVIPARTFRSHVRDSRNARAATEFIRAAHQHLNNASNLTSSFGPAVLLEKLVESNRVISEAISSISKTQSTMLELIQAINLKKKIKMNNIS